MSLQVTSRATAPTGFTPEPVEHPGDAPDHWNGPTLHVHSVAVAAYWEPDTGLYFDVHRTGDEAPLDLAELHAVHAALGVFLEELAR